jgi:hypothetical protein
MADHQDVPNEETKLETIGDLEDQYRDWHIAIGCCKEPKK